MLLNFHDIIKKYNVQPKGVIHCGAHHAEEHSDYLSAGISRFVYIEPCAKAFAELKRRFQYAPNVKLFNVACGDERGTSVMYTGDNTINHGQSNSLLRPALHLQIHPEVEFPDTEEVDVELLDALDCNEHIGWNLDLLVMDCQGYETFVIRGGRKKLESVNFVYTEINFGEVYENCGKAEELDALLSDFQRVETGKLVGDLWTDAFYIRQTLLQ